MNKNVGALTSVSNVDSSTFKLNVLISKENLLVALTKETNLPEEDNEDPRGMLTVLMLVGDWFQEDHQSPGHGSELRPLQHTLCTFVKQRL